MKAGITPLPTISPTKPPPIPTRHTRLGLPRLALLAASLAALLLYLHSPCSRHFLAVIQRYSSKNPYSLLAALSSDSHPISSQARDWNQYVWHRQLARNASSPGRLIAVGDVHGMGHSLEKMLRRLNYEPSSDTVLLLGDLAAKHPSIKASLRTISYARSSGFLAIRGNHDQDIIAWRNWMVAHRKEGSTVMTEDETLEPLPEFDAEYPSKDLKHKLPKGWKWKSQHFEIARRLPQKDFQWLLSLSLTYHLPSLHTYFVHAGLMPWHRAHKSHRGFSQPVIANQDSILDIEENRDALTLLEMRAVKAGRKVTSGKKGTPWYSIWNEAMDKCADHVTDKDEVSAIGKCGGPATAVYGHWAAKGLTINRWSIGLDSGCVYGKELSALVIGGPVEDHPKLDHQKVAFQDQQVSVVTMKCKKP